MDENIPIPTTSESYVTDNTISPFSEKLMMIHSIGLGALGISMKGMAIVDSGRADSWVLYSKLLSIIMKYAEGGTKIAIENKWLERLHKQKRIPITCSAQETMYRIVSVQFRIENSRMYATINPTNSSL